jgi:hypothetical protein
VNGDDVRMVQLCGGARFAVESLAANRDRRQARAPGSSTRCAGATACLRRGTLHPCRPCRVARGSGTSPSVRPTMAVH